MVQVVGRKFLGMYRFFLTRAGIRISLLLMAAASLVLAPVPNAFAAKPKKREVHSVFKDMQPMTVRVVRNAQGGCEPDCAEWISAEGDIVDTTPAAFKKVFAAIGKRRLPVFINSGGGSIEAAMSIGAMLRERRMDVSVTRTELEPCQAKDCAAKDALRGKPNSFNAYCASACTLVLAAGVKRLSSLTSHVGVHQIIVYQTQIRIQRTYRVTTQQRPDGGTRTKKTLIREKRLPGKTFEVKVDDRSYKPIESYLARMGIAPALIPLMEATPHTSIHWMSSAELNATQLVTDEVGGDVLLRLVDLVGAMPKDAAPDAVGKALAVPMFHQGREITVDVEVIRLARESKIALRLSLHRGAEALTSRGVTAKLALGAGKDVEAVNTAVVDPFAPLEAISSADKWCGLTRTGQMRLSLSGGAAKAPAVANTKPVQVAVAAVPGLVAILADVCAAKSAASN
jgi:hypothetical protein